MPVSVLFVCLGNICRSPMAEAVFTHIVSKNGLDAHFSRIDSAGTAGYHVGDAPDTRSAKTCRAHGVPVNHKGQKVSNEHFASFDYMLCMDDSNLSNLMEKKPKGSKTIVKLFGEFDPQGERVIEDPYYGGIDGFEHNFQQVVRASVGFLKSLGHEISDDVVTPLRHVVLRILEAGRIQIATVKAALKDQETGRSAGGADLSRTADENGIVALPAEDDAIQDLVWKSAKGPPIDVARLYNDEADEEADGEEGGDSKADEADGDEMGFIRATVFMLGFRFFQAKSQLGKNLIMTMYKEGKVDYKTERAELPPDNSASGEMTIKDAVARLDSMATLANEYLTITQDTENHTLMQHQEAVAKLEERLLKMNELNGTLHDLVKLAQRQNQSLATKVASLERSNSQASEKLSQLNALLTESENELRLKSTKLQELEFLQAERTKDAQKRYQVKWWMPSLAIAILATPAFERVLRTQAIPWRPKERNEKEEQILYGDQIGSGIKFAEYEAPEVSVNGSNCPPPIEAFEDSLLHKGIKTNIKMCGYTTPTPVQKYTISYVTAGRDVMACAQTGSGKTAAFLIPILSENFFDGPSPDKHQPGTPATPITLILAPTRELAIQIRDDALKLTYRSFIRAKIGYGGTAVDAQCQDVMKGCEMLVATPGRLLDMIERRAVSLKKVKYFVMDEADRMLDMGFLPQIRKVVQGCDMPPKTQRQTLMFSATFPREIQRLATDFLHDHIFFSVGRIGAATSTVTQTVVQVNRNDKRMELIKRLASDPTIRDMKHKEPNRYLIFVRRKVDAETVMSFLNNKVRAAAIHGDKTQQQRENALNAFRKGECPILVATSVAARGLDVPLIHCVINYDLPDDIDEYVHRIGRAGRAGHAGKAVSFFDPQQDIGVASRLASILREGNQECPSFLTATSMFGGMGNGMMSGGASKKRGGGGTGGGARFAGGSSNLKRISILSKLIYNNRKDTERMYYINKELAPEKRKWRIIKVAAIVFVAAALIVAVAVFSFFNIQEAGLELKKYGINKSSRTAGVFTDVEKYPRSSLNFTDTSGKLSKDLVDCINRNIILVTTRVVAIDPIVNNFRIRATLTLCGDFVGDFNPANLRGSEYPAGIPFNLTIQQQEIVVPRRQLPPSPEITISFESGDVNQYPFDRYITPGLLASGVYFNTRTNRTENIALVVLSQGGLQTWNIDFEGTDYSDAQDATLIAFIWTFSRSGTTKFFALFIMILMWFLALLAFTVSVTIWNRKRKVEPPMIGVTVSLLFALPAVRNTQPGAPAIGCTSDVISFFWAMAIVAISAGMNFINYLVKYTKDKPISV
ncbi:DEAD-box ATP-dependent RNA helicase [Chytridiales sp. JEL 0842]|nr:DEAD-box ATP-dependent RNA helicase [Chytridiales sp. JEL 0842]